MPKSDCPIYQLRDVTQRKERATLLGHLEGIVSLTFAPDRKTFGSSSFQWLEETLGCGLATGQSHAGNGQAGGKANGNARRCLGDRPGPEDVGGWCRTRVAVVSTLPTSREW